MNRKRPYIITYCLIFQFILSGNILMGQAYEAKLNLDWEDGSTVVEGLFLNNTDRSLNLNFQLIIERKSKTGNVVNNRQSGSFQVFPKREKLVTLTRINIDELDFYRIYFKVYKKDKIIAEDYIVKWEKLGLELSDNKRLPNEEKKSIDNSIKENKANFGLLKNEKNTKNEVVTKPIENNNTSYTQKTEIAVTPEKTELPTVTPPVANIEKKQDKKQTYTTPSVKRERKLEDETSKIAVTEIEPAIKNQEKEERQQATKDFLTELIEQHKEKAKQTPIEDENSKQLATKETVVKTEASKVVSEDIEFGGLIFDDTRTKTGRDFYDIFYSNYIPPKGAENFNITIKELPGRGRLAQVAVLVNDNQVLLRLLQPRAELVEEQAIQSVYAIEGYLRNAAQLKKQLESVDQQGSGIF